MNESVLTTTAFTGFTVAFFHAAISDPLAPFRGSGSCATVDPFQNPPDYGSSRHRPCPRDCAPRFNPNHFWSRAQLAHRHVVPANSGSIADRPWSILHLATAFRPCSQPHSLIFKGRPWWGPASA